MKRTASFSIDESTYNEFFANCQKKETDKNECLGRLLREFNKDCKIDTIKSVTCPICGATYSEKLNFCPNCASKEVETLKEKEMETAKMERDNFQKAKADKEMAIIELELQRLNSIIMRYSEPGGTDRSDDERIALLTTYMEKAKELRGRLLDMENGDGEPVV